MFTRCCASASTRWSTTASRCAAAARLALGRWLIALVVYDFCYYWLHRAGHEWHCSGPRTWCTTRARTTTSRPRCGRPFSGWLLGWIFYLPMAVAGVPPLVFGVVALIDLLYQFWVHTEQVGRSSAGSTAGSARRQPPRAPCGERRLPRSQLRRRLIVWDRLFGSFGGRERALRLRHARAARSWDPLWANPRSTGRSPRTLACAQLARQAARLVQATGLAARRRGGALPEARILGRRLRALEP